MLKRYIFKILYVPGNLKLKGFWITELENQLVSCPIRESFGLSLDPYYLNIALSIACIDTLITHYFNNRSVFTSGKC